MPTASRTWKKAEARGARLFGALRMPLSGSSGRADRTASDTTHPDLFIEVKLRERHTVRSLHDRTRELARKERKTPILVLSDKHRPGQLLVVHEDDMPAVVAAWCAARVVEGEPGDELEGLIRRAVLRLRGEAPEPGTADDLDGDPPAAC